MIISVCRVDDKLYEEKSPQIFKALSNESLERRDLVGWYQENRSARY